MVRAVLNAFLFFPTRSLEGRPADAGLDARELRIETDDGERLHAWWVEGKGTRRASILLCHGNGGNIGDRVEHVRLLARAGFAMLLFDYRGYGHSTGRPTEEGTYRDARAALRAMLGQDGVDAERVVYVGESLGGAVALQLALESPPAGLVLQSAFTGVRDMAAEHYGLLPRFLVPDAYPSRRRVAELECPLLVVHGERDEIVPPSHGRALYEAAPGPKDLRILAGVGHNDLVPEAGVAYAEAISAWWSGIEPEGPT
jgi:uncharacterized protein